MGAAIFFEEKRIRELMSRAFVKEDVDVPERTTRRRSPSGLPPGALNYLTAQGANRLQAKAAQLRTSGDPASAKEIEGVLQEATVVERPDAPADVVTFGAVVTVRLKDGTLKKLRVVGVDELEFEPEAVSWISLEGRALLGTERGTRVNLGGSLGTVVVLDFEHP